MSKDNRSMVVIEQGNGEMLSTAACLCLQRAGPEPVTRAVCVRLGSHQGQHPVSRTLQSDPTSINRLLDRHQVGPRPGHTDTTGIQTGDGNSIVQL